MRQRSASRTNAKSSSSTVRDGTSTRCGTTASRWLRSGARGDDFNVAILNNDLRLGPHFVKRLATALRADPMLWAVTPNYDERKGSGVDYVFGTYPLGMAGFAFMLKGEAVSPDRCRRSTRSSAGGTATPRPGRQHHGQGLQGRVRLWAARWSTSTVAPATRGRPDREALIARRPANASTPNGRVSSNRRRRPLQHERFRSQHRLPGATDPRLVQPGRPSLDINGDLALHPGRPAARGRPHS